MLSCTGGGDGLMEEAILSIAATLFMLSVRGDGHG